jgi:hypothetical protein
MFDANSLPQVGVSIRRHNNAEIKEVGMGYSLCYEGRQWMTMNNRHNIQAKELYSSYDQAYGDVVLSGLGFGLLALWIAQKPEVASVRVYEKHLDIINLFVLNNGFNPKIILIHEDINTVATKCDCLFLDHYEFEETHLRLANMAQVASKIEHTVFWAWALERDLAYSIYGLTQEHCYGMELTMKLVDFRTRFDELPLKIKQPEALNEYVYTYFDKIGYTLDTPKNLTSV